MTFVEMRKTVIRANYGIFYDRAPGNLEAQSITGVQLHDSSTGDSRGRFTVHDDQPHQ